MVTPLSGDNVMARRLAEEGTSSQRKFAAKNPSVRAFAGTRTDDGMDFETFADEEEIQQIVDQVEAEEFRFQSLIKHIVLRRSFMNE